MDRTDPEFLHVLFRVLGIGGLIGTIFGAIAFSIVSFTCVAPFLGGFAGLVASKQYSTFEIILAGVSFATAFASPFFVLALFPSLLKKLPKSGSWLDRIKAVMGFEYAPAEISLFHSVGLVVDFFPGILAHVADK